MKKILMPGAALCVFLLAGCGDGYEMRAYNNTPYGDRTAGSGVEYVRANMMPQKGLVQEAPPPVVVPEPEPAPEIVPAPVEEDTGEDLDDSMMQDGESFLKKILRK